MNKKTKTYLLILAVFGVWGTIAFKFFAVLNPELPTLVDNTVVTSFSPQIKTIDSFKIEKLSRDPFLGTLAKKKVNTTNRKVKPKDTIPIPKLKYLGILKSEQSNNQIYVLNINGNQHLVKKGQVVNDLRIIRANSKDMIVKFKNKSLTLPIQ